MKKYSLTDAHRAQLKPWADKWIANAFSTRAMTGADLKTAQKAMRGLYRAAKLKPPANEVFCPGPVSGAIAATIASGVWWLRENQDRNAAMFGRRLSYADIDAAARAAVAVACGARARPSPPPPSTETREATRNAIAEATWNATTEATTEATLSATLGATRDVTANATWNATTEATLSATEDATDSATRDATRDATADATWDATRDATRDATANAMEAADPVCAWLLSLCPRWHSMHNGGSAWSSFASYLSFFRHVAKLPIDWRPWSHYETLAEISGSRYMHARFWIVCERPEVLRIDDQNRPHCATGPSHVWRDGVRRYYWHGVNVPGEWIERPATIDPSLALTNDNIEQRRALAEILGWERVLSTLSARTIDKDADPQIGELIEAEIPDAGPARFLRVRCGTGRTFVLPVPPEMRTALEANAWTYAVDAKTLLKSEVRT